MERAKIKIVFETEYDLDPRHYNKNLTPEEMLDADIEELKKDPWALLETTENWAVTGEIGEMSKHPASEEIDKLMQQGHPYHCACRQVWGDGECECKACEHGYDPDKWMEIARERMSALPPKVIIVGNAGQSMSEQLRQALECVASASPLIPALDPISIMPDEPPSKSQGPKMSKHQRRKEWKRAEKRIRYKCF